jgi:alanyl-tRNA synthetase
MKKLTSNEIRKMFLDYFESKGHLIVPSASLIPLNDPSILWINAGVAPLKKYFDGREIPPKRRLANSQKCIRTNDIENVGDTYHHTFFEMLGNFSVGDYFRDEALGFAWELLTSPNWYGIDKERLYVTVYTDDNDAYNRWLELGVSPSHIIKSKENFWDIGPGPCGPDSEIFFDRGEEYDKRGPELIENDIDNDRYIEIWNNVFSQYNHIDGLERKDFPELPHKNIDTGMGLERLVCVLQNGKTNYDTDLFSPIIKKLEELSGEKYTDQRAFRAIADHIKTLVFALSDGASFSNEGRGYVLRRILRRASRFGRTLGINEPFMYKLTNSVIEIMKEAYPYLLKHKDVVDNMIKKEEEAFLKTLSSGEKRLNDLVSSGNKITGSDVFKLYDTYGFPYELTKEILGEKGIEINKEEFDKCMQEQRQRARDAFKNVSGMNVQGDVVNFKDESVFTGYEKLEGDGKVIFVGDNEGNSNDIYSEGIIITDKTPFYAEMGGQTGDIGLITGNNLKAEVLKTEKAPNGQAMHFVRLIEGDINVGDVIHLSVDKERRFAICQDHSATHLLQRALKDVLGEGVNQAGSYLDGYTLRFDFNYEGEITDEDVIKVEEKVNDMIKAAHPLEVKEMKKDDAIKLGAMALFGEKYGDVVRVVKFGPSVELCGGTHVTNTANIRSFAIKSIESKGLNVYRIEAACDTNLEIELFEMIKPYNDEMILLLKKAKRIIKDALKDEINLSFNPVISNERPKCYKDVLENKQEVITLRKQVNDLEKAYKDALISKALEKTDEYAKNKVNGKYGDVVILSFDNYDTATIKSLAGSISSRLNNGIVFISNIKEGAINFVCKANDSLKDKFDAGALIKDVSKIAEGSGGGSKTFAAGGGVRADNLQMIEDYVKSKIVEE